MKNAQTADAAIERRMTTTETRKIFQHRRRRSLVSPTGRGRSRTATNRKRPTNEAIATIKKRLITVKQELGAAGNIHANDDRQVPLCRLARRAHQAAKAFCARR